MSRVTAETFVAIWQLSDSVSLVAAALGRPVQQVRRWARRLVRAGVRLKHLPLQRPVRLRYITLEPSTN